MYCVGAQYPQITNSSYTNSFIHSAEGYFETTRRTFIKLLKFYYSVIHIYCTKYTKYIIYYSVLSFSHAIIIITCKIIEIIFFIQERLVFWASSSDMYTLIESLYRDWQEFVDLMSKPRYIVYSALSSLSCIKNLRQQISTIPLSNEYLDKLTFCANNAFVFSGQSTSRLGYLAKTKAAPAAPATKPTVHNTFPHHISLLSCFSLKYSLNASWIEKRTTKHILVFIHGTYTKAKHKSRKQDRKKTVETQRHKKKITKTMSTGNSTDRLQVYNRVNFVLDTFYSASNIAD